MKPYDGAFNGRSDIVFYFTGHWGVAVPIEITGTKLNTGGLSRIKVVRERAHCHRDDQVPVDGILCSRPDGADREEPQARSPRCPGEAFRA